MCGTCSSQLTACCAPPQTPVSRMACPGPGPRGSREPTLTRSSGDCQSWCTALHGALHCRPGRHELSADAHFLCNRVYPHKPHSCTITSTCLVQPTLLHKPPAPLGGARQPGFKRSSEQLTRSAEQLCQACRVVSCRPRRFCCTATAICAHVLVCGCGRQQVAQLQQSEGG